MITAKNLPVLRKMASCSQWMVAKNSGVSRYKISCFEMGYAELTDAEKTRIAEFLKTKGTM